MALQEGKVNEMETALEQMFSEEKKKTINEAKREMALRMLKANLQIKTIIEVTGLSESEINELKSNS